MRKVRASEKIIEQKFCTAVRGAGGYALKLTCPGFVGMPDRMVLFPSGRITFVEVKSPGEQPRPIQIARFNLLRHLGFMVFTLDDDMEIPKLVKTIKGSPDTVKLLNKGLLDRVIQQRKPLGLFMCDTGTSYIGVDNRTGEAWTEEFGLREECLAWLKGGDARRFTVHMITSNTQRSTYSTILLQPFCSTWDLVVEL
jgi:hypothetical protein